MSMVRGPWSIEETKTRQKNLLDFGLWFVHGLWTVDDGRMSDV